MINSTLLLTCAAWATVVCARADITSAGFVGSGIVPVDEADIRMESADVTIQYGHPSSLVAEFVLINDSSEAKKLTLGFPVGAWIFEDVGHSASPRARVPAAEQEIAVRIDSALHNDVWRYADLKMTGAVDLSGRCIWYYFEVELKPGPVHVKIDTELWASGTSLPSVATLSYCMSTGGKWKGPIGRERVSVIFAGYDDLSFVESFTPESGRKETDRIVWEFEQIKPTGREYDITVRFSVPEILAVLRKARDAYEANPEDDEAAIRYVKHLFMLGAFKGNAAFPPTQLTDQEYAAITARVSSVEAEQMSQYYHTAANGGYAAQTSGWTNERIAVRQLLADSGYSREAEGSYVMEGKRVIEQVVARNPRHAHAWNLYLFNFWRVSFGAMGGFGSTVFSRPQRELIATAFKHVPDDPGIQFWQEKLANNARVGYEEVFDMLETLDLYAPEFQNLRLSE